MAEIPHVFQTFPTIFKAPDLPTPHYLQDGNLFYLFNGLRPSNTNPLNFPSFLQHLIILPVHLNTSFSTGTVIFHHQLSNYYT